MRPAPRHADPDLLAALRAAVRAPSSHNTQPWRFEIAGQRIRLFADRARRLPVNDPADRELTISCGCALFNLRSFLASRGHAFRVHEMPEEDAPGLLAELEPDTGAPCDRRIADLADQIERRRTTRRAFVPGPLPGGVPHALLHAAKAEGAWLHAVDDTSMREQLAALVMRGDRVQWSDPRWRRELANWMRPHRAGDGLAQTAFIAPLARLFVRYANPGARVAATDQKLVQEAPALLVIGSEGDRPRDWLRTGQALQRVLLTACSEGIHAGYMNQPNQVPELRAQLRRLLRLNGWPQVVVRMGSPHRVPRPSSRRPLEKVVESGDGPVRTGQAPGSREPA